MTNSDDRSSTVDVTLLITSTSLAFGRLRLVFRELWNAFAFPAD
jgi:hypothetical protein